MEQTLLSWVRGNNTFLTAPLRYDQITNVTSQSYVRLYFTAEQPQQIFILIITYDYHLATMPLLVK